MQCKQFGNFLTAEDLDHVKYKRYKYIIRFGLICCVLFMIIGIIGELMAIGYNSIKYQPVVVNRAEYDAAQSLNNELRQRAEYLANTRPSNVNAISAMSAILQAKPDVVKFDNITITPANIFITGKSNEMDSINKFVQNIEYPGFKASVSNVGQSDGFSTYKITISPDNTANKPKAKKG